MRIHVTGWANRPALHLTSETERRAYYRPGTDSVHMPARSRFVTLPTITAPYFMNWSTAQATEAA
jgi:antirestriction protein ArdC